MSNGKENENEEGRGRGVKEMAGAEQAQKNRGSHFKNE